MNDHSDVLATMQQTIAHFSKPQKAPPMTVDIPTKLAAIRSIVDDIALHFAQAATAPIAPKPTALFGDRLAALEATVDSTTRRIDDLSRRVHDLAATVERLTAGLDENDRHIEHLHGRQDAMEAAWQDHVSPAPAASIVRGKPVDIDKDIPF